MPSQTWRCIACGATNPPHKVVCRSCWRLAPRNATQDRIKRRRLYPTWVMTLGLIVILGPEVVFVVMATFPTLFRENTILFWHYFAALGWILYVPIGLVILLFGLVWRYALRDEPPESKTPGPMRSGHNGAP